MADHVTDDLDPQRMHPHDIAAELATLGAMMHNPGVIQQVRARIEGPAAFYRAAHQVIYTAICDLTDAGTPADPVTLRVFLAERGESKADLSILAAYEAPPSVHHAANYAAIVARLAARRVAVQEVIRAHQRLQDPSEPLANILTDLYSLRGPIDESEASRLTPGGSFVLDAPSRPRAIWGRGDEIGWAAGEALMIVGPAGVGKTTLVVQLVAARLGIIFKEVLGLPVQPGERKVLYLAMDRPPQISRAMARLFGEEHRQPLDERLVVWRGPPLSDFARNPDVLAAMCKEADADTVIVDSLKDGVIKLSEDEAGSGYNRARQKALIEGAEVIELHHQRKAGGDNKKPSKLDDVYGSTWLTAGAGSVILLWGEAGDPIVDLSHLKQPMESIGPWKVTHDHVAGLSEISHQVDLLWLIGQRGNLGLTPKDAAGAMFSTQEPSHNLVERARRKLNSLVKSGHLVPMQGASGGKGGGAPTTYFLAAQVTQEPAW